METELRRGYSGTARRKGRKQTNQTYFHRATSLLYAQKFASSKANVRPSTFRSPSPCCSNECPFHLALADS